MASSCLEVRLGLACMIKKANGCLSCQSSTQLPTAGHLQGVLSVAVVPQRDCTLSSENGALQRVDVRF